MAVTKSSEENEKPGGEQKPVEKTEKQNEPSVTLTLSEIDKLIDARIKERTKPETGSAELIKMLTEALNKTNPDNNRKFDKAKYMEPEPEDLMKEPVVFWSQGFQYVIGDDKKNGRPIPAPLGVIDFKAVSSVRRQNGKEQNMLILSKHVCQSKKELAFLRNHTMYGIRFFEKSDDVESVDVRYASLIAQHAQGLRNMDAYRVFEQAKNLKLPLTTDDPNTMRIILAQHYAKADVEKSEEAMKASIRKEKKEALLAGHKDAK